VLGERQGTGDGAALHGIGEWGLHVDGKAKFSTGGTGVIPAGATSVMVSDSNVTGVSHVSVTLTSDPGAAPGNQTHASLKWVARMAGSGFRVHMTRPVGPATTFTYLITEPV
jgi:hypothetical protein